MAATVALSGCYTVLRGPQLASTVDVPAAAWETEAMAEPALIGSYSDDLDDPWTSPRDGYGYDGYGYGNGYPVGGYDSRYGLYGFGSPFAYGPGLGAAYPYGRYSSAYGPYGYGYDPYYYGGSGGGSSYVPPGYQLVTTQELADLRAENSVLRNGSASTGVPAVTRQDALRRQQDEADRAWTQRTVRDTRKSTSGYRTPRPASTSSSTPKKVSSSSGTSTKPASSSSSKGSGSDAAKRRKTRR